MTDTQLATTTPNSRALTEARREEIRNTAIALLHVIPEADADAGIRIIEQIMSSSSAEDMDRIWEGGNLREWIGYPIVIRDATRAPSDYKDGLGFFLILDCLNPETGEPFTITTGSQNVVVQVAWAIAKLGLPFSCVPLISEKPSTDGYYPQRLSRIQKAQ